MIPKTRIGVVGFSRPSFDQDAAKQYLEKAIKDLLKKLETTPEHVEVVSGLTNTGVPRLAYELAVQLGIRTVGFSASRALRVRSGIFPVDEKILVGKNFGDESEAFIAYIEYLIRIGGGLQSRHEVKLFREKLHENEAEISDRLIEYEVKWLGKT